MNLEDDKPKFVKWFKGYKIFSYPGIAPVGEKVPTWYGAISPISGGRKWTMANRESLEEIEEDLQNYISSGGYKKWEDVKSLVTSKTNIRGRDIDPEIRDLIGDLNNNGFATLGSCSGHHGSAGFVTFAKPNLSIEEREKIRGIFANRGIHEITFKDAEGASLHSATHFRGIG